MYIRSYTVQNISTSKKNKIRPESLPEYFAQFAKMLPDYRPNFVQIRYIGKCVCVCGGGGGGRGAQCPPPPPSSHTPMIVGFHTPCPYTGFS